MEKQLFKVDDLSKDWTEKIREAKEKYEYQPILTAKLDAHDGDFKESTLLEIVLWKINRYPVVPAELLSLINDLRRDYSEDKARNILRKLLGCHGFDLPMASTLLRFACPDHLQIIDQRVYRLITPGKDKLKIPYGKEQKIELYFEYIERLKTICRDYKIEFKTADRDLYQLDKIYNKDFKIKY